jgi:hypothetical protein
VSRLVSLVWARAIAKGLLGGDRRWVTVFGVMGAAKVMHRIAGRAPEAVYCEELKPGETLIIRHLADETLG